MRDFGTMRHLVLVYLFAGFLFQPATADPAYRFEPREIELISSRHRVVVKTGPKYEFGTIEVALIGSASQSRKAVLSERYEQLDDVRVVSDKLLIRGPRIGRHGGTVMEIHRLDTLEKLDRLICGQPQVLSPSGRFVVYEKGRSKPSHPRSTYWDWDCPTVFLYDLRAETDTNRVAENKAKLGDNHVASDSSWPIFPPDASVVQAYLNPTWKNEDEYREYLNKGFTFSLRHVWSENERLVAFVLRHNIGAVDRSLEGTLLVVVELDPEGRPVDHHKIEVPDSLMRSVNAIVFIGSSIRLVGGNWDKDKVTWIPDSQPWQR